MIFGTRAPPRSAAALAACLCAVSSAASAAEGPTDEEIRSARPGQLLRVWPLEGGAPAAAKAYRVLYRSTGLNGEPIPVTGAIIFPDAPAPREGRHVVAWAHPTTGVVERCAPTLLPDLSGTIPGLKDMLARGWVIAATDYQGLGTPGMHPYLVGESEARTVLDIVRAARQLPDSGATERFAVWGHSQGGHAALFTGELAAAYAPELKLVGVAAAAPATYLDALFEADRGSIGGNALTAMALLSWARIFGLSLDGLLMPGVEPSFLKVAESCIESIADEVHIAQVEQPLERAFLEADPTRLPPWRAVMDRNTPGQAAAGAPVLLAQGTADDIVESEITRRFADQLCRGGALVRLIMMEGVDHGFAGQDSALTAVAWMADRFAGRQAPNDCGR